MNTFSKDQRLCSHTQIDDLFSKGKSIKSFPLKIIYRQTGFGERKTKILISVPKRLFKKATERNKIKRLIREVYRVEKNGFEVGDRQFSIAFVYLSSKMPDLSTIKDSICGLIGLWKDEFREL